jgi:hypothetical protein
MKHVGLGKYLIHVQDFRNLYSVLKSNKEKRKILTCKHESAETGTDWHVIIMCVMYIYGPLMEDEPALDSQRIPPLIPWALCNVNPYK